MLKAKHKGFPSGVFATQPGGKSIVAPCFVLDLVFPLPFPLPLAYLFGRSVPSDVGLLSGLGAAGAFGAGLDGSGIRYGISSGDVRRLFNSASKGVVVDPGSDCNFPTRLLEALMNICLSHSTICWSDTDEKPDG